jgi:3-hydroxymyristoyl/3-hydroxydecanoyl-(acyl carrier protein) dehydratase
VTLIGTFFVAPNDACLDGHFPETPVVPGVVLLDEVAALLCSRFSCASVAGIPSAKFTSAVSPGQLVEVYSAEDVGERIEFTCLVAGTTIARGAVRLLAGDP